MMATKWQMPGNRCWGVSSPLFEADNAPVVLEKGCPQCYCVGEIDDDPYCSPKHVIYGCEHER